MHKDIQINHIIDFMKQNGYDWKGKIFSYEENKETNATMEYLSKWKFDIEFMFEGKSSLGVAINHLDFIVDENGRIKDLSKKWMIYESNISEDVFNVVKKEIIDEKVCIMKNAMRKISDLQKKEQEVCLQANKDIEVWDKILQEIENQDKNEQ